MASEMQDLISELSRMQIEQFFLDAAPLTQDECDQMAREIIGGPVRPSAVQGATSYTVVPVDLAAALVVQFRAPEYAFDLELLDNVKQAYGVFVPQHKYSGNLGNLIVYTMENVGGVSAYLARNQLRAHRGRLLNTTLQDFASFFASAWHNTPPSIPTPSRQELYELYRSELQLLRRGLPKQFGRLLNRLIEGLPGLFAGDWPMVPNHTDLLENNIHVNPETGSIAGICDWKDTEIGPFGTSIEGLESLLGERTTTGWRWVSHQADLRRGFWQAFAEAMGPTSSDVPERIDNARLVGIFRKHGFEWVSAESRAPVRAGSSGFRYLEAVTLGLGDTS